MMRDDRMLPDMPHDWRCMVGRGYPVPVFELHKRGDSRVYLVRNTILPPYKFPSLSGAELSPTEHGLLSQWKAAQAFLAETVQLVRHIPQYPDIHILDMLQLPPDAEDTSQAVLQWCENGYPKPAVVAALCILNEHQEKYCLALDLAPVFSDGVEPPKRLNTRVLASVAVAARHFNFATSALFEAGFVLFSSAHRFGLGEVSFMLSGYPEWATVIDI